jgi:hypothetical protein
MLSATQVSERRVGTSVCTSAFGRDRAKSPASAFHPPAGINAIARKQDVMDAHSDPWRGTPTARMTGEIPFARRSTLTGSR